MIIRSRSILALGAFFVLALVLAACGGVPGNGVARVDDAVIKKSSFDHWLRVAASASQPPGAAGATPVSVPDAPKFTKCTAQKAQQQQAPAKGQPRPTAAQFKQQCQQEYSSLRDQAMQFLIFAQWLEGEASDQGIKVSDKDIDKQFNKEKAQSFPKPADFQKFVQSSGMTLKDLKLQVKLGLLRTKIRAKVTKAQKITDKQISAYYNQHRQSYGQPERRNLLVVLTKTPAKANQAKSALKGGKSFAAVAKQFSIDNTTKAQGGKLTVAKGQQEQALDSAASAAKIGQLVGPVKSQFGYYVFKVTKVTPGSQQTLAQAKETIRRTLTTQGQQTALTKFSKKFEKKWKSRTDCRKGFQVMNCKNAPKQTAQQGAAPGAVPQQGGAQQVPQQGGAQQVPQQGAQQVPQQGAQQVPPQGGGAQQVPPQGGGAQQVPGR
ncbi:MAG: peptidyl-prolyl cis-trans isomerase [Actinomycetota bacterium]|nr:peptidyl-prolyl cis-trans isomerase [Actinomycetota bacterium]